MPILNWPTLSLTAISALFYPQKQCTKLMHKLAKNRIFRSMDTVALPQYVAQSTVHTCL